MTPNNGNYEGAGDQRTPSVPRPKSKQARNTTGRIKMLLAPASVAGTLGGWATLAHNNTEDRAAAALPVQAAYVSSSRDSSDSSDQQATAPTAAVTDTPQSIATPQPSATATTSQQTQAAAMPSATATLQPSATAPTQPSATATTQPTQVLPTATTVKPNSTPMPAAPQAVTKTKSSR